ncbi:MAG: hypothetical protein Q8P61_04495 [Candidatus Nanopelagicales bacterium]|nr:hypothetical protein [Candidatus Nanopelagicales bacterium]
MLEVLDPWIPPIDPTHPAAPGPVAFRLTIRDDHVAALEPRFDLVHRGVEKLFESRDLRQCLVLADRHDWHGAFNSELGLALLLENALGIETPDRAQWLRTLLAELTRAIHGVHWLTETLADETAGPSDALVAAARQGRGRMVDDLESISGGRMHPMINQPGGLRSDATDGWLSRVSESAAGANRALAELADWLDSSDGRDRWRNLAVLPTELALEFVATGVVARASGLSTDLRLDRPYCRYGDLADSGALHLPRLAETVTGDAWSRLTQLAAETRVSLTCVTSCAAQLKGSDGPISVRLPRTWRIPEGEYHYSTEGPTGVNSWFLVSRGGSRPRRLKIVSASFANARALCAAMIGARSDQLRPMVLSSMLVAGDLGR